MDGSSPTISGATQHRSRFGCTRCKKRRQKCDEQKPQCKRCVDAGVQCKFTVQLRWGGRSFSRSRFGNCMTDGVQKLESPSGDYIYAPGRKPSVKTSDTNRSSTSLSPPSEVMAISTALVIPESISTLPGLTIIQKSLLHHFITYASSIISCHPQIQTITCRALVPMATQVPSLFSAIMALSQIHKDSLNITSSEPEGENRMIQQFITFSMHGLRGELQSTQMATTESTLATILTLCMCSIHTGGNGSKSWRVHFDGARALLASLGRSSNPKDTTRDSTRRFLERWYISIEALAALTNKGLPTGQLEGSESTEGVEGPQKEVFLDDYFGFSTDLISTFRELGAAAWERKRMNFEPDYGVQLSETDFEKEVTSLECSIKDMIIRDDTTQPSFYPEVAEKLAPQHIQEFILCNKTYQHTALLHLYRRVRELPSSAPQVQRSVKAIIDCTSQITPSSGLSPWIVLTTPLFYAGCEALGPDRATVANLLSQLYHSVRIKNIQQALDYLQRHWKKSDDPALGSCMVAPGIQLQWNLFKTDYNMLNRNLDDGLDFIPY